jgi:murein L,D-transpeptidase YcbB/YkuD
MQYDLIPGVIRYLFSLALALLGCAAAANGMLWFESGRPNVQARQAVSILASASEEGLRPENYNAMSLRDAFVATGTGPALPDESLTMLDAALTTAMCRFLTDLHLGRVDPREIEENFSRVGSDKFDASSFLREAVRENRLIDAVRRAAPAAPQYSELRRALVRYRTLADNPETAALWREPLPPLPGRKIEPGESWTALPILTQRLIALGDLPFYTPAPVRYEGDLVRGVQAFQSRHGLESDGIIGKRTFEQLNIAPPDRIRQIELTMERLRWTPFSPSPRLIVINIPGLTLQAYEIGRHDGARINQVLRMKVIIGNAEKTPTPLFDEKMRFIEFSPFWNVPPSIAQKELVPRLRHDPTYFSRQGFEFVSADGQVASALSNENLDKVVRNQMRIRQRPGPLNALGDIKFVFPNNDNIYLHHTPTPRLFLRERRDFSHGCIRVEDPVALARFVLQDAPEWTDEQIRDAMAKGVSSTLRLPEPVRVVIAYNTVEVGEDGRVYFFQDIYGQDRRLDDALRRTAGAHPPSC